MGLLPLLRVESEWWLVPESQMLMPDLNSITSTNADDAITKEIDNYCA